MSETPDAIKPVVHGGYPDAATKPVRQPILLQIAKASDDHDMWERRHIAMLDLYRQDDAPYADRDGVWSINDYLDYIGQAAFGLKSAS